jgi:CHAT domain-containing protein
MHTRFRLGPALALGLALVLLAPAARSQVAPPPPPAPDPNDGSGTVPSAADSARAGADDGFALITQGRLIEALRYFEAALETAVRAGDRQREAGAHHDLATVHVRLGAFEEGLRHWALADSLFRVIGDPIGRANARFPKANAHFFQGDYAQARETVLGLIEVHRAAGWEDAATAIALVGVGETYLEEEQAAEAERWVQEGLAVAERIGDGRARGFALLHLGRVRLALGRADEAEADLRAALALAGAARDDETQARAQNVLAQLYLEGGRLAEAEAALEAPPARAASSPHFRWEPLYTLALVRLQQERDDEAVVLLEEAVDVLEGLRLAVVGGAEAQRLFAGGGARARVYQTLIETYQHLGRADVVVRTTLRWNQETERTQRRRARAAVDDPRVQAAYVGERERRNAVEAAEQAYAAAVASGDEARIEAAVTVREVAEEAYRRFVREVIGGDPALAALVPQGVDLQGLMGARTAIPDDAVVLLYMVGADRLFAIAVTRTTTTIKDIAVPYDEVDGLVRDLRAHLATHPGTDRTEVVGAPVEVPEHSLEEATARLYALLVAPVEAELEGRARLSVIPGGPLQLLPFAVLRPATEAPYLVERFVLSTVPNFNPFAGEPAAGPLRIRAFANPPGADLPNTVAEVEDLRGLYPDAEVFLDAEATEDRAKDIPEAINVLHFATHGNLDARIEDSYLTLAPNPAADEDGAFRLNEMDPLVDARAGVNPFRLVTLSACHTAVGNLARSGWPFNPASQFLYASRAVVASLWAVDDAATARLMGAFYRRLAGTDAAAALQAAQREILADERYRHPYYWAPFVLFGDDR